MQTPVPPLITTDSHNSKSKMSLLTPFSNLTSSTNDVISPIPVIGAVWIFTRNAGVWTQQGTKLIGTGYVGSFPPEQGNRFH
jgi:hypothetical protein